MYIIIYLCIPTPQNSNITIFILGITECVCIEGTILSGTRCHLDVYKTLEQEKDLPQFIVDHDHCLSSETQLALRTLNPPKYFYIFVPSNVSNVH